ncbi:MAG: efflux transporter outer membrane subunit [Burkholderiaceae bacterium]
MKATALLLVAATAGLWGCVAQPPARPATVSLPAAFSGNREPGVPHDLAAWWTSFDDPVLSALVTRALAANLDVAQAVARVREARLQERIVRGGQGPQANASGSGSANRLSRNALPSALANMGSGGSDGGGSSGGLGLAGETFRTWQAGFDASWELDLFGGDARANDAAQARTQAALWSRRDAEVVLVAEVADTYLRHRSLQRRLSLSDEALASQGESLAFARVRARHGLAGDAEVARAQQSVLQAAARREELVAQAGASLHGLALLLGLPPTALQDELAAPPARPLPQPDVPPGLPSDLLERRPDIRAAERQAAAALADIGVARADLYPRISLTGALQLASRSLSTLVDADSVQANVGARLAFPLLGRDRLHATVDLREVQADAAALAWRQAVLRALRDVEDALTRLDADRRRADALAKAADAARDAADTAAVAQRHGLDSAAGWLAARQALLAAQDTALQGEAAAAQDVVGLYKALGGGWDERRHPEDEDPPSGR